MHTAERQDAQSAYPVPVGQTIEEHQGMSLVAHFAGKAMEAMLASREFDIAYGDPEIVQQQLGIVATCSVNMAEALVRELRSRGH